ncbi:MAG: carboxymuconolactone decarboxylase family protein [Steroidobacteraceae bacterium]
MTWIRTIDYGEASGRLRELYQRVKGPGDRVDNILTAHSLRPHTLEAHLNLYRNVLHHPASRVPKRTLEAIGVYVSALNGCHYCVDHHTQGMRRLLGADARWQAMHTSLLADRPEDAFEGSELEMLRYARQLALTPRDMSEADVVALRGAGLDDGEILEVNQVVAYFAYANRTVLGLGITTEGDVLGHSPSDSAEPDDGSNG